MLLTMYHRANTIYMQLVITVALHTVDIIQPIVGIRTHIPGTSTMILGKFANLQFVNSIIL